LDEKAKVNTSHYVTKLLPNLIKDCRHLLSDNLIFQQDGAPAQTAARAQDWIEKKCPCSIMHVLLQVVDILNTQFKYREGS